MPKSTFKNIKTFAHEHYIALIVTVILLAVNLFTLKELGVTYSLYSDDYSYILSGFEFKKSGTLIMHGVQSAQIMPGMTVFIAFISALFGESRLFLIVLRLIWIVMGALSAFVAYLCVELFTPKWCAIITMLFFFRPDFLWTNNLILTETPFILFFLTAIYATIMMGKSEKKGFFWLCLISYLCAFMLKANFGIYPVFAGIYLLLTKYNFMKLLRQGLIITVALLAFIVPWSIRNYQIFDEFIPLTYGAGNPTLLGTYQGYGYPSDESLDYETNVDQVAVLAFSKYYNDDGTLINPDIYKYIELEVDGIKAQYRIDNWLETNPKSFLISYFVLKPLDMIRSVFYWHQVFSVDGSILLFITSIENMLAVAGIFLAFVLKKQRAEVFFLVSLYFGNIYIYAMTFSFDRYACSLTPLRFVLLGITSYLFFEAIKLFYGFYLSKFSKKDNI